MEDAAKKFARRILLIHLALLAVVIGLVFFASREVYKQTREQATEQAKSRQALLAAQTAADDSASQLGRWFAHHGCLGRQSKRRAGAAREEELTGQRCS